VVVLTRHGENVSIDNAAQFVTAFLFGKSLKTIDAAKLLACQGYGEDALILLRNALDGLFSVAYITVDDSENRALSWIANGHQTQVAFIQKFPEQPLPPWVRNWEPAEVKAHAKRWPNIKCRAVKAQLDELYDKHYSFLCSHAHSDAWSSLTYIESGAGYLIRTEPTIKHVDIALLIVAELLRLLTECFCRPFGNLDAERPAFTRMRELHSGMIAADAAMGT
jgi:hypothetical protein